MERNLNLAYAPFFFFDLLFCISGKLDYFFSVELRRCPPGQAFHSLNPALAIGINHILPVSQNVVRLLHAPQITARALRMDIFFEQLKDSSTSRDEVTALHIFIMVYFVASNALAVPVII